MVKSLKILDKPLKWLDHLHEELPEGVHHYPTLKGKKRFGALVGFNFFIGIYVLLHKFLIPVALYILKEDHSFEGMELGLWYLYHFQFMFLFHEKNRKPFAFFAAVAVAWFGMGYLPLAVGFEVWQSFSHGLSWTAISSLLCYGSSAIWTSFMVYRLRMPTTAFLFQIDGRVRPKVKLALPFFLVGLATSLLWLYLLHM